MHLSDYNRRALDATPVLHIWDNLSQESSWGMLSHILLPETSWGTIESLPNCTYDTLVLIMESREFPPELYALIKEDWNRAMIVDFCGQVRWDRLGRDPSKANTYRRGKLIQNVYNWKKAMISKLSHFAAKIDDFKKAYENNKSLLPNISREPEFYPTALGFGVDFAIGGFIYELEEHASENPYRIIGGCMCKLEFKLTGDSVNINRLQMHPAHKWAMRINPHVNNGEGGSPCLGGFEHDIFSCFTDGDYFGGLYMLHQFYLTVDEEDDWGRSILNFSAPLMDVDGNLYACSCLTDFSKKELGLDAPPLYPHFSFNDVIYPRSEYIQEFMTSRPVHIDDILAIPIYVGKDVLDDYESKAVLRSYIPNIVALVNQAQDITPTSGGSPMHNWGQFSYTPSSDEPANRFVDTESTA